MTTLPPYRNRPAQPLPRPYCATRSAGGFTLIEVLVVVAIIALLVAILLPSLNQARAQARNAQCLSNLKQHGTAMQTYALTNNDIVPRGGNADTIHWTMVVAKEMKQIKKYPTQLLDRSKYEANGLRVHIMPIFHCPERVGQLDRPFLDYVVNAMIPKYPPTGWDNTQRIHTDNPGDCKLGAYRRASEVIYIADAADEKSISLGQIQTVRTARANYWHGVDQGNPALANMGNRHGGIAVMDVWRGKHVPEGKDAYNTQQPNTIIARRAGLKMHLRRFTNAGFFDSHAEPVQGKESPDPIVNYAYWLKLFGLRNWEHAARIGTCN